MEESKELLILLGKAKKFLEGFLQVNLFNQNKNQIIPESSDYAEKLVDLIEKKVRFYDFYYYEKNESLVSDSDYDELKNCLEKILKKFPYLKGINSVSNRVGSLSLSHFQKVKHKNKMFSLANAFDQNDIRDWYKRVKKSLSADNKLFASSNINLEPKVDGVSISLQYVDGKLDKAVTRGDGEFGEDVTSNVKGIAGIPLEIANEVKFLDVRGEIYLTKDNFALLESNYSTPRNTASGLVRQKNPENIDKLDFFAYGAILGSCTKYTTHSEIIDYLVKLGFNVIPQLGVFCNIDDVFAVYENYKNSRYQIGYDIDGLVLKIDLIEHQDLLGFDSRVPKWAIAYKFPPADAKTKIVDIQVQVGRLGTLTPVAILEPINIGGVFISRANLHNEDYINDNDIRINDKVLIERAGDIIPQVSKSFVEDRDPSKEEYKLWQPSIKCPSCNSDTEKDNAYRRCSNKVSCPEQNISSLKHFVSKYAFDIQGLGDKTIRSFYDKGILRVPSDVFNLKSRIKSQKDLEHFCKLLVFIEKKRNISLGKFIYALGIPNIGRVLANSIASLYFGSNSRSDWFRDMKNLDGSKITSLEGVGEIVFDSLKKYFAVENNLSEVEKLLRKVNISNNESAEISDNCNNILKGEVVVFTGTLKNMGRSEAVGIVEKLGGRVSIIINKNTTLVVFGDNAGSKLDKAKKLNLKMLSYDEWIDFVSKI